MGMYAPQLNELQAMFANVSGQIPKTANFQVTMRIYKGLKALPEVTDFAAEILGKMTIKVPDRVYAEDKEAVDVLADTIVNMVDEIYYCVRSGPNPIMTQTDAQVYLKHVASSISITLDL